MLVAELQELEEVKGLINRGQQLGVLTYGDIASAVSERLFGLFGLIRRMRSPRRSARRSSMDRTAAS